MTRTVRMLVGGFIGAVLVGSGAIASAGSIQTTFCNTGTPVSAWAPIAGSTSPGYLYTVPAGKTFLLTQVCSAVGDTKKGFSIETNDCFPSAGCTMTVEVAGGPLKTVGDNPRCVTYDPGVAFQAGAVIQARDNNDIVTGGAKVTIMGLVCP